MNAQRRYRAKIIEARELRSDGMSIQQIAGRLRSDVSRVRKWVRKYGPQQTPKKAEGAMPGRSDGRVG